MGIIKFVADKLFANNKEMVNVEHKGLATAWVNFDGADGSIRDSFNISNVERTEAGKYEIFFDRFISTGCLIFENIFFILALHSMSGYIE